jgi:alpha-methylacyl-CoA racemase
MTDDSARKLLTSMVAGTGPLAGLRVVELAAIGPTPHAAMVLADLGAEVVRVDRPSTVRTLRLAPDSAVDTVLRGRWSVTLDLKDGKDLEAALALIDHADVILEGLRPGVAERLGIGPDVCLSRNPRLVYARMTGWGQFGPLAKDPGHDINYVALTGALHAIGPASGPPPPPLNLVGDFGGGSMLLLLGVLAALWERATSGTGQTIDAAMVDGVSLLAQPIAAKRSMGIWSDKREDNIVDGGAPFYRTYACADGKFVAVGSLEPRFYRALIAGLGFEEELAESQMDRASWPWLRERFATAFGAKRRDEWVSHFTGTDACVTPVLTLEEAAIHAHLSARKTWVRHDGMVQAAPAPRFSRTPGQLSPVGTAEFTVEHILARWSESTDAGGARRVN